MSIGMRKAAAVAVLLSTVPFMASAQSERVQIAPKASPPAVSELSRAESLRTRIQGQQKLLEEHGREISALVGKLKGLSESNVESRIVEIRTLRDALVALGTQLQQDAPLSQSVDQYQSWIAAQLARVNGARTTLGQEFVEQLVKKYQTYQQQVTRAREALGNHSTAIDRALRELMTAEVRAGEMLMAEDAGAAATELLNVLEAVGKTVDDIRNNLRQLGTAGV